MKKIWQLFVGDLKRLRSNVVTGIIVLGLIALPSIFSVVQHDCCVGCFRQYGQPENRRGER